MTDYLLDATGVVVEYPARGWRKPPFQALHAIDLNIVSGETVGLVGESGSGETTFGRAVLGLVRPVAGSILFDGMETVGSNRESRRILSRNLQVVFQDPNSSLNPSMTVEDILSEPLLVHKIGSTADARVKVRSILDRVNLPSNAAQRYPREFSGGQRQRIAIARALMVEPKLIVCDEPVSALDVSTQDRVVNLLIDIQKESGVAYLFIAHDLALVRQISNRVAVMYRGDIVERGDAEVIGNRPTHAYTKRLLLVAPVPDPARQRVRRESRLAFAAENPTFSQQQMTLTP